MRQAQVITFGVDDAAVERLQALLRSRGVAVRPTRKADACLGLLRQDALGVLLLRVGKNLENEFTLLASVAQQLPRVATVVWGDADHPRLAGLALDLGACAVFLSAEDQTRLHDVILRLLPE